MFKRKLILAIITFSLLFSLGSGGVIAHDNELLEATRIELDNKLLVNKFNDGRISPVNNAAELNETQLDKILTLMGFTSEDLSFLSLGIKQDIVSGGGKKIEVTTESASYTHKNPEGGDLVIHGATLDEVNQSLEEMKQDQVLSGDASDTVPGWDSSGGKWKGKTYIVYMGMSSTGTQFRYNLYNAFEWEDLPFWKTGDSYALAWGSTKATYLSGSDRGRISFTWNRGLGPSDPNMLVSSPTNSNGCVGLEGCAWGFHWNNDIDLPGIVHNNPILEGYGKVELYFDDDHAGDLFTYAGAYHHPHFSFSGIGITIRGMTFTFSGISYDNWEWTESFTIGTN